jgi:hypothetical protein
MATSGLTDKPVASVNVEPSYARLYDAAIIMPPANAEIDRTGQDKDRTGQRRGNDEGGATMNKGTNSKQQSAIT